MEIVIQVQDYVGISNTQDIHRFTCELISAIEKKPNTIVLRMHEGFCFRENGFLTILDEILDNFNFKKSNIILENNNFLNVDYSPYSYRRCKFHLLAPYFYKLNKSNIFEKPYWNNEFLFGQFLALPRSHRLNGYYFYKNSPFKTLGLTSFNSMPDYTADFLTNLWIKNNLEKFKFINQDLPYSEIDDQLYDNGINFLSPLDWSSVYNKIGIEFIYETLTYNSFFVTEKTIRPILYCKPFFIVGAPHYEKRLKEMGFYTFDDYIDKGHDEYGGELAAQVLYDTVLPDLVKNKTIEKIYKFEQDKLIHNRNLMVEFCKKHLNLLEENSKYYE